MNHKTVWEALADQYCRCAVGKCQGLRADQCANRHAPRIATLEQQLVEAQTGAPGTPLGRWKALLEWIAQQSWYEQFSSEGFESQLIKHLADKEAECERLRDQLTVATQGIVSTNERHAALAEAVKEAPHHHDCRVSWDIRGGWGVDESKCRCWKADALRGEG